MNNADPVEYVQGIFLYETKHRFMCMIMINGEVELCHVASSMKLEKIIALSGKRVLLTKNFRQDLRTQYTLYSLLDRPRSMLNLSYANDLVYNDLERSRKGLILKEKYCNGYKTDLLVNGKCIIEVKTVLSDSSIVNYPCTNADRGKQQLIAIKRLLDTGYKVELWFVYLNNCIKEINITDKSDYKILLNDCILAGLKIIEKRVVFNDNYEIKLKRLNKSIMKI